jgi:isocitrate/isopropylmalate dehydrogenase
MSSIEIPVIAGDGIGPEITAAVLRVVEAAVGKTGWN